MVRTQIYLTEEEHAAIGAVAGASGVTQSEIIRDAIDRYLSAERGQNRKRLLRAAQGIWSDRDDLPESARLRAELDRE